jgi:hypothetical protein
LLHAWSRRHTTTAEEHSSTRSAPAIPIRPSLTAARNVENHGWFAADRPAVVTRRNVKRLSSSELKFLAIIHSRC